GTGSIINISSVAGIAPELLNGVYGGSKAYVLSFSLSLQHELAPKGIRVQAVLPGPISTEPSDVGGMTARHLPPGIVMTAENLVDAALTGLDRSELVTIPALADKHEWDRYEATRRCISTQLSRTEPVAPYSVKH
ncbi:MAG TPA: SDR family NAD(P)-dependent oxidoreductase, partial [Steroidobacteraceae bacterium]|nr:SDR family NAD(P)-dependent oxidoreductase [Steroidobacteraceae bacterium]